jgi:Fur family transcriptional regulator, ferric uptake regulator
MSTSSKHHQTLSSLLEKSKGPLSADEIREHLGRRSIGQATVYRLLRQGVEEGVIRELSFPNSPNRFELACLKHHHHFQCNVCDRVFDLEGCVEQVTKLAPKGFVVDSHDILLFGRCEKCEKVKP